MVTQSQWQILFAYLAFILIGSVLALVRRWVKPQNSSESLWRKYPAYIFINLTFLLVSWSPPAWHALSLLLSLLGGLAAWEILRPLTAKPFPLTFITCGLVFAAGWLSQTDWLALWLFILLILAALNTWQGPGNDFGRRTLAMVGSVIYLPLCLAAYLWIAATDPSGAHIVFLYLTVATNDALAQITGQLFGRNQLASRICPAKTVEGAVGGILFAGAIGFALAGAIGWTHLLGISLGLVIGLAGLIGDLTASNWKRALGLKDFSNLLGAHGGVLDRFDGLIFAAPVFYLLLRFI
jgi:phosphatidate cytidylyltransferase